MEKRSSTRIGTDFTQGKIMPLLLRFALPFLLANALNSLYNTVDTIIIGQFMGSGGIVAVSMGGKMLNFYTYFSIGLASAGQVYISQQLGAGQRDQLNSTIGTLFSELFLFSFILMSVTLAVGRPLLELLNTPPESMEDALAYLRITTIGLPLIFGYNAVSSVLRGMGDSKSPLLFIAIATVINIVLDIVFILYCGMGAAGAALATVIGQGCSLVFSIAILYRKRQHFGFDFKLRSFAICWDKLWIMLKLGVPTALRSLFIVGTQLFVLRYVNACGLAAAAAYNVSDKIYHLANIVTLGVRSAGGTMVAQNIGAGKLDRVRQTVHSVAFVSFAAAAVLSAVSLLAPELIFSLFTNEREVLEQAPVFMLICSLLFFISAAMSPYEGVVSGTGNAALSFVGGILDGVVLRVSLGLLFGLHLGLGAPGFFLGDTLARLGVVLVGGIYYHSGAWMRHKRLVDK